MFHYERFQLVMNLPLNDDNGSYLFLYDFHPFRAEPIPYRNEFAQVRLDV